MKNIKFISLKNLFRDEHISEPTVSLNNSIELLALSTRLGWRISLTLFGRQGRISFRCRQIHNFFNYILRLNRKHGGKYVVTYLKSSQLAIQKAIAGNKLSSLRELEPTYSFPRLTQSGFPRYIPLSERRAMKSGSKSVIRFWLTLFAVYRVISIPGKLKLNTITDPFLGDQKELQRVSHELAALAANSLKMFDLSILKSNPGLLLLESASPTSKVSWLGIFTDPFKLAKAGLGQICLDYMQELGYSRLLDIWVKIFKHHNLVEKLSCFGAGIHRNPDGSPKPGVCSNLYYCTSDGFWEYLEEKSPKTLSFVGKLSKKLEAAGKVRVFAMVDIWTQSMLKPLHSMLSTFLASLPNDGTRDQISSWKRAAQKSLVGHSFGYDLSAATDRLPIAIQVAILEPIIGKRAADLWKQLLVKRSYALLTSRTDLATGGFHHALKYAVGQPMGALSSFNMLAVTHHFLVQLAYQRSLPFYKKSNIILLFGELKWYDNYEITGDDLVLFDEQVASEYLKIMKDIGVPINQTKSVIAKVPAVEYLKVTTLNTNNVSALSWRMFISNNSFMGRINTVYTLLDRDYIGNGGIINWLRDTTCQALNKGNINLTLFSVLTKFYNDKKLSIANVFEAIVDKSDPSKSLKSNIIKGVNKDYLSLLISNCIKGNELKLRSSEFAKSTLHWINEYMKHKMKISVSAFADSKELSLEVVDYLFPIGEEEGFLGLERPGETYFLTYNEKIQYLAMRATFFNLLWDEVFFPRFKELERPLPYNNTLEDSFEFTDSLDRYLELKSILLRAKTKVSSDVPIIKKPKFTMNLISLALKASKWRKDLESRPNKIRAKSRFDLSSVQEKFNEAMRLKGLDHLIVKD